MNGPARTPDSNGGADLWADAELLLQSPRTRYARHFIWALVGLLLILLIWAALAPIDEVARGQGKVIPSRHIQIAQSLDGGVISDLKIREGDVVEAGQLLLRIDPTRYVSSLRENASQLYALQAKAARLQAIAEGHALNMPASVLKADPLLAAQEQSLFLSRRQELNATISIARQQLEQRRQELNEAYSRREQASQSYNLTNQELTMTRNLSGSGAVSEVEILRLQRDAARFRGERDAADSQIPRLEAAIREAQRKIQETDLAFRNQAKMELADTMAKLQGLTESGTALQDRVDRTAVVSPVRGTIKRLLVTTVGGVVQPGKDLVEIVPLDDTLLLEARIQPRDIAFLRPGQKAVVRFSAYDFAVYGGLDATLEHIGADTVTDEQGNTFYTVHVRTHQAWVGSQKQPILPGMVADVDILTGKKTVLSYLLKPVLRAKSYALSER